MEDIQKVLSKGINFNGIFGPYRVQGDPALAYGEKERQAIENKLKAEEFQRVADLGFTHVRLNLGRVFLQETAEPFNLRPDGLAFLDKAVDMAIKRGMGVVFDMHPIPPPNIFHDPSTLDAFRKMWRELAAHYAKRVPQIVFELLNEPVVEVLTYEENPTEANLERWRAIVKDLVAAIRGEDPDRYIIVTGAGWGEEKGTRQMGSLGLSRLLYSFHYYEPMVFTHQAATWSYKALTMVKNVPYPVPAAEVKKWWDAAKEKGLNDKPFREAANGFNKDDMRESLHPILDFAKKEGVTLYCGEFGVHKPFTPSESRAKWTSDFVDLLNENGVGWAMWEHKANFGFLDEKGQPDPAMVKALGLQKGQ